MTTVAHPSFAANAAVYSDPAPVSFDPAWQDNGLGAGLPSGSHTNRIVAAAGAVESLEWELDRAQSTLATAIEQAAANGCGMDVIARAAGLTKEEVATMLWAARSGAAVHD